jgi:hypothetical protein
MLRIDAEIAALPMTMSGQNMKRLVDRRACPNCVVDELGCKGGEQTNHYCKEE